jgi:hypothetical protein
MTLKIAALASDAERQARDGDDREARTAPQQA